MKRLLVTLLLIVSFPATAIGTSESGVPSEYFTMSVPRVKLRPYEAIYGLRVDTTGAVITRTKVPLMWDLTIDNSDGERTHLHATAIVGAWALRDEDFNNFKDFLTIGKIKNPSLTRFDIRLTLELTDDETGNKRNLTVPLDRIPLKRSSGS